MVGWAFGDAPAGMEIADLGKVKHSVNLSFSSDLLG